MVVIGFIAFLLICFIIDAIIQYYRKRKAVSLDAARVQQKVFDESRITVPQGLYFDKSHTWAFMDQSGEVKVGLDDFLQQVTGKITRVDMKSPGEQVNKGEKFIIIIQEGKHLNIKSPVTGTIKCKNEDLINNPTVINSSPYRDGWLYTIKPQNWPKETGFMLMAEKANEWIRKEFLRLKDFLVTTIEMNSNSPSYVTLQDGGSLKEGVLSGLSPEIWEEFQNNFLDTNY